MVSAQPSTSTNSSSLNGIETIVGDSIIMPSDIRVDETTRSMIRKGRKIRKPIWKAVLSSLVTKAGSRIEKGTSCGRGEALGCRPCSANSRRSVSRVWRIMKPWSTVPERDTASSMRDLAVAIGRVGGGADLVDHRPHHEQREEQREADQHLVGRRLLEADRLPQDREHDDDAGEAGHHQQQRRQHRQQAHEQQDLQRQRQRAAVAGDRAERAVERAGLAAGGRRGTGRASAAAARRSGAAAGARVRRRRRAPARAAAAASPGEVRAASKARSASAIPQMPASSGRRRVSHRTGSPSWERRPRGRCRRR